MRRGFTILELLISISIISVLITITALSVSSSIKAGRAQRANAVCTIAKQGLETYYAQKGSWPWGEKTADHDDGCYWLTAGEIQHAFFEIVREAKQNKNPMMDISGLVVCTYDGAPKTRHYGYGFLEAVRGSADRPKKLPASSLHYGYLESNHGYFRRFVVKYSPATDSIIVRQYTGNEERSGSIGNDN